MGPACPLARQCPQAWAGVRGCLPCPGIKPDSCVPQAGAGRMLGQRRESGGVPPALGGVRGPLETQTEEGWHVAWSPRNKGSSEVLWEQIRASILPDGGPQPEVMLELGFT